MGRGIERAQLFRNDTDRADFVVRLAALCEAGHLGVYAGALMPNHFHLVVHTGVAPLHQSMKKLLTGYGGNFTRRHQRGGHLLPNRYKAIVVEAEPYLLEVTRYIHLNPLRGHRVPDLAALRCYPWTGHAALLGRGGRPLAGHRDDPGRLRAAANAGYPAGRGVRAGGDPARAAAGPRGRRAHPEPRGLGPGRRAAAEGPPGRPADARILGRGEFTEALLAEAARHETETLRLSREVRELPALARQISAGAGRPERQLRSGSRRPAVVRARRLFCQVAVQGMGYAGAAVARCLGVTTSSVNRLAASEELREVQRYLKAL